MAYHTPKEILLYNLLKQHDHMRKPTLELGMPRGSTDRHRTDKMHLSNPVPAARHRSKASVDYMAPKSAPVCVAASSLPSK